MAKRKKRNAVTIVSLLLALVVLIALYVWYSGRSTTKSDDISQDTDQTTLASFDTSKATSIHFIGSDVDLTLSLKDGVWSSDSNPERPINQDNVNNILTMMSDIKATQTVTAKPEDLTEYGLKEPSHKITVTLSDGKTVTLSVGDQTVSGDGFYAQVNDSATVYILDSSFSFDYKDTDFTQMESPKGLTAQNITYISVDNREGTDYELKKIDSGSSDNCGAIMYKWRLVKPFGEGYSADSAAVSDVQANYADFNFVNCVDYSGKDLGKYGLDNPIAKIEICYDVTATTATPTPAASGGDTSTANNTPKDVRGFKLYVGNKTDNGDYYVKTGNSNMVYTMSGDVVNKMLTIDAFKIMTPYVNIPHVDNVDKITAEVGGKQYSMDITRTPSKDKNSTDVKETFSYNGKVVDEQNFRDVYKMLITPRYDSWLTEKVDTSALKPIMTVSFHITVDNKTITTTFYPYDKSFYIVDKGTGVYFLTDKRAVDDMATAVSTFKVDK